LKHLEEHFGEGANIPSFASPADVLTYDCIMECFETIRSAVSKTEADLIVVEKVHLCYKQ